MNNNEQKCDWISMPGLDAQIMPFLHHADLTSCNSYVIRFPSCCVVIDPGGLTEQSLKIHDLLHNETDRMTKPVFVFLTHSHYDHACALQWEKEEIKRPCYYVCHSLGAKALREADAHLTASFLYAEEMDPIEIDTALFTAKTTVHAGMRISPPQNVTNANTTLMNQEVTLPGGETLCFYHTPGHSPDSVCIKAGPFLFTGDLLFAHQPVIAGMPGWSQPDLTTSLHGILELLQTNQINALYAGHGHIIKPDFAMRLIQSAIGKIEKLTSLSCIDEKRTAFLKECATAFMKEVDFQLAAQGGRLQRLLHGLVKFEEQHFGEQIVKQFDLDEFDTYLRKFHAFADNESEQLLKTSVPLEGVTLIRKVGKALGQLEIPHGLALLYVQRMEILLQAYLNLMLGIDLRDFATPTDLTSMLERIVEILSPMKIDHDELADLAEIPEIFALYLARRIDEQARPSTVEFTTKTPIVCMIEPDHLATFLGDIMEFTMSGTPRHLTLAPIQTKSTAGYRLSADPAVTVSSSKHRFFKLFATLLGGTFEVNQNQSIQWLFPTA